MLPHADNFILMPDDSFKEFVLDQFSALPELRAGGKIIHCAASLSE